MLKKLPVIIGSIAGVGVVATLVVVGLVLFVGNNAKNTDTTDVANTVIENDPAKADPAKQESQDDIDLSKDLGACKVVTKDGLVSALGSAVPMVAEYLNRGYALDSAGSGSQSCVFAFSKENAINDRFTVSVTEFKTDALLQASRASFTSEQKVEAKEKEAYFLATTSPASEKTVAQNDYNVFVYSDKKLYTFTISRPADSDTFTETSAQMALVNVILVAKM